MSTSYRRDVSDKSKDSMDLEKEDIWYPPVVDFNFRVHEDIEEFEDTGLSESEFSYSTIEEEALTTVIKHRFRAIVAVLLGENNMNWVETINRLAWQAGNFVKPDITLGSNMDPRAYVKIKRASGNRNQSVFIDGIVCTQYISNEKMNTEKKNPKMMLLAESLKHETVADQLASFNLLLPEEQDQIKKIKTQIESLCPDVLLVEKNLSSYVKQYQLGRNITLVLSMKKSLLDRIACCTGARICLWGDSSSTAEMGKCKQLRTETMMEQQEGGSSQSKRNASKTLMYFEGCPRPLGCTVLLRGNCRDELKKIKQVVQRAVFAAYHFALENAFYADEGSLSYHLPIQSYSSNQLKCLQESTVTSDLRENILVFFSSRCMSTKQTSERSRPLRIKFSEHFDKPLGTYLKDDLFTERVNEHIFCYTHQNEKLAINVKRLTSKKLPGEEYGNIWMWHRCLRCDQVDGLPPAIAKAHMSDETLRLSFGKFLQLSFSNHPTATRVASCGHSLQTDFLQFFGLGSMVVGLRRSSIDILTVHLPLSVPNLSTVSPMADDFVITVYEDDPESAISYALNSKEYKHWIVSRKRASQDDTKCLHFVISFNDNLSEVESKLKLFVKSYHETQFETLRKNCCLNEVDFVRSLKRCKEWQAQGGKSKAYFAKSMDGRFIIKEVVKSELRFFKKIAQEYFRYFSESSSLGHLTCMAKILGLYQVSVNHVKGSKQTNNYYMVMENIFYNRNISKVYDIKGSERSRYNSNTNSIGLDMNLLEEDFIYVGREAKRKIESAVWNDTSFLCSIAVIDYSLLVGLDEEKKELVIGIIDILRTYTLGKKIESVAKASGLLGGPPGAVPTIIAPIAYKNRFRNTSLVYLMCEKYYCKIDFNKNSYISKEVEKKMDEFGWFKTRKVIDHGVLSIIPSVKYYIPQIPF